MKKNKIIIPFIGITAICSLILILLSKRLKNSSDGIIGHANSSTNMIISNQQDVLILLCIGIVIFSLVIFLVHPTIRKKK